MAPAKSTKQRGDEDSAAAVRSLKSLPPVPGYAVVMSAEELRQARVNGPKDYFGVKLGIVSA